MNFSPKSVTATEANPASVVSYDVKATVTGGVGDLFKNQAAHPSGVTVIPIGDLFDESMVNKGVTLYLRQNGVTESTDYVQVSGTLLISEIPNGAENVTVQV